MRFNIYRWFISIVSRAYILGNVKHFNSDRLSIRPIFYCWTANMIVSKKFDFDNTFFFKLTINNLFLHLKITCLLSWYMFAIFFEPSTTAINNPSYTKASYLKYRMQVNLYFTIIDREKFKVFFTYNLESHSTNHTDKYTIIQRVSSIEYNRLKIFASCPNYPLL